MIYTIDTQWPGLQHARDAGLIIGRTMGIAWDFAGQRVFVFHEGNPAIIVCNIHGEFLEAWGGHWPMAHGCHLGTFLGQSCLWLTNRRPARVACFSLNGILLHTLDLPSGYNDQPPEAYQPSDCCQTPDGSLWLADGYGSGLLHRYDPQLRYLEALDGAHDGLPRFANPHAVDWDARRNAVVITDRGHRRLRWYRPEGSLLGCLDGTCHSPSACAVQGHILAVAEMWSGIKLLDTAGAVLQDLGANAALLAEHQLPPVAETPGYRCDFPHGLCAGDAGSFWFTEGVDGGRVLRLVPQH